MLEVLCFDICALAILSILLFALIAEKIDSDKAGKRLESIIVVTILTAILDMIANFFDGRPSMIPVNYICNGGYFVLRTFVYFLYAGYIVKITGIWRKNITKLFDVIKYIPLVTICVTTILAPITGKCYYYDSNGFYNRGDGFLIIYTCSAIYAIYAFFYIVKSTSIIGKKKAMVLSSCAVFSLIGAILQFCSYGLMIEILGLSLSLLFVVVFVENPGDKIERSSLLLGSKAYFNDVKMIFFSNRPVDFIHISILNYKMVEEMLSFDNLTMFSRKIGSIIRDICNEQKVDGSIYDQKHGYLRIILNGNNLERTEAVSKLLLDALNKEIEINEASIGIETSIGISQCPQDFNIMDDMAAYGKVAWKFEKPGEIHYTKDIMKSKGYELQATIDKQLENALQNDKFDVMYRPLHCTANGLYDEVDAMLRLRIDGQKYIEQDIFFANAEQSGLIIEIGEYILKEVCSFISSEEFIATGINKINIRLSTVQCLQRNFAKQVFDIVDSFGVSPETIRFIIMESLVSDNQNAFENNIRTLADEGFSIALGNYGAGYSNIISLSTMPIEVIRFDKTFAKNENNERLSAVFENSVEMVKALNKIVLIEGVEKMEDAEKFKTMGFDYMNGSYFAKTMTKKQLVDFYNSPINEEE